VMVFQTAPRQREPQEGQKFTRVLLFSWTFNKYGMTKTWGSSSKENHRSDFLISGHISQQSGVVGILASSEGVACLRDGSFFFDML
jgi:hypothetical protein